jgi:peroxiredoxin
LRRRQQDFDELNVAVLVVSFEPPRQAARVARTLGLPYPVLSDPDRRAYRMFGLKQGQRERLWSTETAGAYLRGLLRGTLPRRPRGDTAQLGGDFVIDARGRIVFAHRGTSPADRPQVSALVDALREAVEARR